MELAWDTLLDLGSPDRGPLHQRLADAIRATITAGLVPTGSALPPSRQLASDLRCSRWVVTEAYGQLIAEGYLEARSGSATRVRLRAAEAGGEPAAAAEREPAVPATSPPRFDLAPGLPDLRAFPRTRWAAALRTALTELPNAELGYPDPAGHGRLREVLASYLRRQRRAEVGEGPDVTITTGITDGVLRVVRACSHDAPPAVAVEDPGWTRLRTAVAQAGTTPIPIAVDHEGLRVGSLTRSGATIVVVGAAHQFPTGTTLSERRRRELVSWARRGGGLIIEDDYDAEFRYDRDPVASVQGTAPDVTVLLGSVSKTLAPGLGIGWMLAPRDLSEAVRRQAHPVPSTVDQLAFAHLLRSGGYDRHLRSVRRELARRRAALLGSLTEHLPDAEVSGAEAGLHLLVRLPGGVSAAEVHQRAGQLGLRLARLADYQVHPVDDSCLVLGYGNLGTAAVSSAIEALAGSVRDLRA